MRPGEGHTRVLSERVFMPRRSDARYSKGFESSESLWLTTRLPEGEESRGQAGRAALGTAVVEHRAADRAPWSLNRLIATPMAAETGEAQHRVSIKPIAVCCSASLTRTAPSRLISSLLLFSTGIYNKKS